MRSGFPLTQGGTYSVFQHWRNVALHRLRASNVTPEQVVHAENELENNMVATQYPGELRVACSPAQVHQGYGQSQQNLQGLHHQQNSLASVVNTGLHHPIPEDSACTSQNSYHQISRESNADFHSSAQDSAQNSSYFGTLAYESPVRHSVNNRGHKREDSKQKCKRHFLKRSNLNSCTGLQQRQHLNCASTSSAAHQAVVAQTFPLQDQCSSVTVCKKQTCSPLLVALLEGRPSDSKSFTSLSFLSEETNGNTELNTIPHFSDERHCKGQQVKGSQAALNGGWIRTQNLNHSGGTLSTSHQQRVSSPSLNRQPSTDKVLPVGEMKPPTDEEIYDFIAEKLAYFRTVLTQKERNYGHNAWYRNPTLQSDYTIPNRVAHRPTSSASDKDVERQELDCAVIEECSAAVGQALEEDSSKHSKVNTEFMPRCKETDNCATSASVKHSTGTLTEPANGSCKLVYSNDYDQSFELATLTESQDANTKKRKKADEHCSVICKEATAHSVLDSPVDQLRPQYEDISDNDASQLATTLPNTEHEELSLPTCIKDPQYEDISDADSPQNEYMTVETCQVPDPNNGQSSLENEGYVHVQDQGLMKPEIISDEDLIPKQQVSLKTETIETAQQCLCSCYGVEDLKCPKCSHGTQTHHSVSDSPSSVLKAEDETDDEIDYDCFVISVLDLQFVSEDVDHDSPGTNVQEGGGTGDQERLCDTNPTPLRPVLAFDFLQLPVYDTKESFIQAMKCRFEVASGESTPQHEMVSEGAQSRRQSVDSCETEDSCDYSSASEHNYLTVSRKMLKKRSAPRHSETDVSASEKEDEGDEVANTQQCQTRSVDNSGCIQKLRQLIEAKAGCSKHVQPKTNGQQISQKDDEIVIVSDTEDESDRYCKKSKRKRKEKRILFSSESEDSGDASCSRPKRHSPGTVSRQCRTVKEQCPKTRLPSAETPTPQHGSNCYTLTEETLQDACSDLSHSTEKSGQFTNSKVAPEHVKQVIIIDSDTEDDSDQKYKKQSRKRFFSSESDGDDSSCVESESRLCSTDSSLLQRQSKIHDTQLKDVMPAACSDMSHNTEKSGQLIEAQGGSVHVQHKAKIQTASKKRVVFHDSVGTKGHFSQKKADKGISSGSGDSSDDAFAAKDRPSIETVEHPCASAKEKPQNSRLASEDSPEQQPPPVDREVNCPLGPNPVIPRLTVRPCPNNASLILVEKPRVQRQGKAVTGSSQTSKAFSEKRDTCEKNNAYLCRNKPANDRHHATKNNLQANIPKPRMASRQLSESRLSSASSRGLSQSGETSSSSSLPSSKQSTSVSRQNFPLSKLQRSHSYSSPSTSPSATMSLSAKEQLNKDWEKSFYPTKWDKKNSTRIEEDFRATNGSLREARPGPGHHDKTPRQRHKSEPPLLKKIKIVAIQRTKDINRDAPKKRCPVGDGYKWSDKPTVAKPTKGSSREGRKCRPHR